MKTIIFFLIIIAVGLCIANSIRKSLKNPIYKDDGMDKFSNEKKSKCSGCVSYEDERDENIV